MNATETATEFFRKTAMRADGQWFTRNRFRDPRFGYRNSAWRLTSLGPDAERSIPTGSKARLSK